MKRPPESTMHVFELIWPGVWLQEPGLADDHKREVEHLLIVVDGHLIEAALALDGFELERRHPAAPNPRWDVPEAQAEWQQRRALEASLEAQLQPELTPEKRWAALEHIRFQSEMAVLRSRWSSGQIPEKYRRQAVFLYAKAFLYAMDAIGKTLVVIADTPGVPHKVRDCREDFYRSLPSLTRVRDTSHHLEDRVRGLDKKGRPISLKPVMNEMVNAPVGALILDSLNGNRYGSTMNDGEFGEVEVSVATMQVAQDAIQAVLDAFTWKGPKRYEPSH